MSSNSISRLLHANTVPEAHQPLTGPNVSYTSSAHATNFNSFTSAPAPSLLPPPPPAAAASLPPLNNLGQPTPSVGPNHAAQLPQTTQANTHSITQSLYQCADCQKRYSRPEHLARHIQTHTLGKRFFCQVCGKAFARADLLKRHAANHDNDNDPAKKRRRTDASLAAGRVSHACRPCAAARVKCEEVKPCTRCRNRNLFCESASSEPGSTAAMHLLHLSAQAHSSAPDSVQGPYSNHSPSGTIHTLGDSPANMSNAAIKPEEGQLPTPDTMVEHGGQMETFASPYPPNGMVAMNMARMPFSDFLRDVLYEPSMSTARPEESQGLAVLDFCDNTNYDLTEIDFGLLDHWNLDGNVNSQGVTQAATPQTDDSAIDMNHMRQKLVKIWTDSPWRWIPDPRDSGYGEHGNLPVPVRDTASQKFQESQKRLDRVVQEKLDLSSRDRILSIMLQMCQSDTIRTRVASSFPSVDVMDTMTHIYLASHSCSVSGWIHWASFTLNTQWPEWLATAAAGGAVMTPVPTMRRFGFAMQEAVRLAIPARFEENNTVVEDLGLVQTLVMCQDIGLWSGNRRKMEIAECHLLIPITMMRYRGKFQRSSYPFITVEPTDEGQILEDKWRRWYQLESWKRLVFHCYLRDAQTSMTTLAPPTMSYAELTLPLPESRELWFAKSAAGWKRQWLSRSPGVSKRPPALGDLIRDVNLLTANHQRLDAQYSISVYLHCFWNLILEWRQLSSVHRSYSFRGAYQTGPNLILNSRHQELSRLLQSFQLVTSDWHSSLSAQEGLLLNLLQMNLHVSLDDLQLFAGTEGEDQARRVYPILQQWSESAEARQAVWHAGQILRQAKLFPHGHLKDFYAVAVHHAALALWTYGVVIKASRHQSSPTEKQEIVCIDGLDSNQIQRFVGFGQGRPSIRSRDEQRVEPLDDPRSCMNLIQDTLRANFNGEDLLPPIVENLRQLIKQLGEAAWAVGLS
ncbi:C6 transcription factor RegA [Pseudomassariella vexata]|uniref:C6 transcription factor RegA n=1 Tax=Pseudomassariella vexata TaxID=1141098 RepID=A0A1Y2E6A7_9PEZI|nr:C6 transcription factor RegA [Pseudomassariella vexata]ORY66405.1 C6 transcription factor RegA [Pseudomassariella vexata]